MKILLEKTKAYDRKIMGAPWASKPVVIPDTSNPERAAGLEYSTHAGKGVFDGNYLGGALYINADEGDVVAWGQTTFVRYNRGWTKYGQIVDGAIKMLTRDAACAILLTKLQGPAGEENRGTASATTSAGAKDEGGKPVEPAIKPPVEPGSALAESAAAPATPEPSGMEIKDQVPAEDGDREEVEASEEESDEEEESVIPRLD